MHLLGPENMWRIFGLWLLSVPAGLLQAMFRAGMVAHLHVCDCLMACTCCLIVGHEDSRQGRAHGRVLGRIIFTWDQKQGQEPNVIILIKIVLASAASLNSKQKFSLVSADCLHSLLRAQHSPVRAVSTPHLSTLQRGARRPQGPLEARGDGRGRGSGFIVLFRSVVAVSGGARALVGA